MEYLLIKLKQKLFAHMNFHCSKDYEPCHRLKDRPYRRCDSCRVYVFADRFMGPQFQKEVLGGLNENPFILILDSVGCQLECWFCYARDILDGVNLNSPSGWKGYRYMTPESIAECTKCKLTNKYQNIEKKRSFARFRITGGEPLFATKKTLLNLGKNPISNSINFWIDTFNALNTIIHSLKTNNKIEIILHDDYITRGRPVNQEIPTWLTASPEKMEIRFDTNGQLFSSISFTETFVNSIFEQHKQGKLDSIRVNIDYSLKGPTPIEFEWSQSRALPVDLTQLNKPFLPIEHPQYKGLQNLLDILNKFYTDDPLFEQTLRLDIERGINHTDTTKYGTRKLGVLYDEKALNWKKFQDKARIEYSEVNNPIQLIGQTKDAYAKYINDHLQMGSEVSIINPETKETILHFEPYPDNKPEIEYRRQIRENLEKSNKIISAGVKTAKKTGIFGAQVVIKPIRKKKRIMSTKQELLDSFKK